jgi:hypothetical protein
MHLLGRPSEMYKRDIIKAAGMMVRFLMSSLGVNALRNFQLSLAKKVAGSIWSYSRAVSFHS